MTSLDALWSSIDQSNKNRVVLVADSHPYLCSITRKILLQLGVREVPEVSDGFEAIDAICTFDPCAMILDWGIRGMDAREVVRVIRTSGMVPNPKLPIIVLSGAIKRSRVIEAKGLGIDHLLLRPISPMLLQQRLFPTLAIRPPSLLNADNIGLLTPKEVADLLQINQSWLAKARTLGTGPPHLRIGRSVRYREAALVQWTKSQQETSPGEQQSPTRKPNRRK